MLKKKILILIAVCFLLGTVFAVSYYCVKNLDQNEHKNMELVSDREEYFPPIEVEKVSETQIGGNTEYIIDRYDTVENTHTEEKATIPPECIGMTREEFIEYLSETVKIPSAKDKQEGFCACSLLSFSGKKVVVRKTYDSDSVYAYLLRVQEDGRIGVYEREQETLFLLTDIYKESLPQEIREKCEQNGYPIKETKDLYDFLENYSS